MDASQLKEHALNRLGYGLGFWPSNDFDSWGFSGYVDRQTNGILPEITDAGTFIADKLDRPVTAHRQLEAVLLDFWYNHFNVNAESDRQAQRNNSVVGRNIDHFQNEALLPHLLGDFKDMLIATAKSVSMLHYLDNAANYTPSPSGSLNENYAREVMELHTVGVNAGYTDDDVADATRILTGWSTWPSDAPGATNRDFVFLFKPNRHDYTAKRVLNVTYPKQRGMIEGEEFLTFLADYPTTANFLSYKLCKRLVSESPSASVIAAGSAAYSGTRDLKAMTLAIINHADFTDDANFRSKVKPPHRFVASALMVLGAQSPAQYESIADDLIDGIARAGERPYLFPAPNGTPESSAYWISTASMLARFEMAALMANHPYLRSAAALRAQVDGTDETATLNGLASVILPGGVSAATMTAAQQHMADTAFMPDERISAAIQMLLSSPEFLRY